MHWGTWWSEGNSLQPGEYENNMMVMGQEVEFREHTHTPRSASGFLDIAHPWSPPWLEHSDRVTLFQHPEPRSIRIWAIVLFPARIVDNLWSTNNISHAKKRNGWCDWSSLDCNYYGTGIVPLCRPLFWNTVCPKIVATGKRCDVMHKALRNRNGGFCGAWH